MTRMLCVALLSIGCSVARAADMRVFGFEFGKPINLPECEIQLSLDDGQKIYREYQEITCLEQRPINVDGGIWSATLRFSAADAPQIARDFTLQVILSDDAGLLGAMILTSGVQYQDAIFETLRAKYGKPTQFAKSSAQNGFGAAFVIIHAKWRMPGLRVVFEGADTALDSGIVTIDTPRAEKARAAWESERTRGKPL